MAAKVGTVLIDIKADTAKLVTGMRKAENTVKKSVDNIKRTVIGLAAAYASIQSISAFRGMVSDAIDAADATGKLAETMGVTSEELSKLQYAASYADVSIGKLNAGLAAMIRRTTNFVRTGKGAASNALKELGISAEFARKNFTDTATTFRIIAERLAKMPDGFRKTAIAQDIFSKSAADVVRLANMGAEGIEALGKEAERFGVLVPTWAAKMSAAFNDTMTHIRAKIDGIKKTVSYGMLPAIQATAKTIDEWFTKAFGRGEEAAKNMGKAAVTSITGVIHSVGFLSDSLTGIKLVLRTIELGFWYMVKGIVKAFNVANRAANSAISLYNSLPSWMRGEKIDLIPLRDESAVDKKIASTKKEMDLLVGSLTKGREEADKFAKSFSKNLDEAKKMMTQKYTMPKAPHLFDTDGADKNAKKMTDTAKKTAKAIYEEFKGLNRQLTSSFESFFDYTSDRFLKFGDLVESILNQIYMQMMRTMVINPLVGSLTSMLPFAKGGVVQAYASGGIVSQPTLFPMANGTGLMGEAGPEAIMPLTRIGGDLGVKSMPSNVVINVKNETGLPVELEKIGDLRGDDGSHIIEVVMRHAQTDPEFRQIMGIH